MIYFCADDYGLSKERNKRIEDCLTNGALNKVSVLPNGEITDFKTRLSGNTLSLHINLIEGRPLSDPSEVDLLISDDGFFKYSFAGLFMCSISPKRKAFEKQLYTEIQNQIRFWKNAVGEDFPISIDSHQHTHMIPLVFKTLMRVIREEGIKVDYLRIPAEPILPYVCTPSLYLSYTVKGLIKQWILKFLAVINHGELKKSKIQSSYFMGVMFSGFLTEDKIKKLLPKYIKFANRKNKNIELGFHPGYVKDGEQLLCGYRKSFSSFYFSWGRKAEYDTLMNFKKEGTKNALPRN